MMYLSRYRRYVSTAIAFSVILVFPQFSFANTLYFPQVATGGGYTTSFVIINTGTTPVSSRINFYDQTGVNLAAYGRAINVPVGGSTRFTFERSRRSTRRGQSSGAVRVGQDPSPVELVTGLGQRAGRSLIPLRPQSVDWGIGGARRPAP